MNRACTDFPIPSCREVFQILLSSSPGFWNATAASHCPSRARELPKNNLKNLSALRDGKLCRLILDATQCELRSLLEINLYFRGKKKPVEYKNCVRGLSLGGCTLCGAGSINLSHSLYVEHSIQGDTSRSSKPPVYIYVKVAFL